MCCELVDGLSRELIGTDEDEDAYDRGDQVLELIQAERESLGVAVGKPEPYENCD